MVAAERQRQVHVQVAARADPRVADLLGDRDGLAAVGDGPGDVALERPEQSPGDQGRGPLGTAIGEPGERLAEPVAALAHQPGDHPVQREGADQARSCLDKVAVAVGAVERVHQRGLDVGVLVVQRMVALHLLVGGEVVAESLGHPQVPVQVPPAPAGLVPGGGEPLGPELPDGVQQAVPLAGDRLAQHDGLVDEADERAEDLRALRVALRADLLDGLEVDLAGEDRQSLPEGALDGASTGRSSTRSPGESSGAGEDGAVLALGVHGEVAVEPAGEVAQRVPAQLDGGELDGQRYAVEPLADPGDGGPGGVGDLEAGLGAAGAPGEQLDGVLRRQRVDRERVLARYVERLPRRGQQGNPRGFPQDGFREARAGVDQVLAGIEDEEHVPVAQVVQDRVDLRPGVLLGQAEAAGDGVGQQLRIAEPGQLHDPHPIGVAAHRLGRRSQRHARLADAPWPDDGHEACVVEQTGQVR